MYTLKDGTTTEDPRLDRLKQFDERSRQYPVRAIVTATTPRSYTWSLPIYLDQRSEGACVGFSICHELAARPSVIKGITDEYARQVYFAAQRIDPWDGGAYPGATPFYEGTSVLAGFQHVATTGLIKEYRWAFSLEDALMAIGYKGPGVAGLNWYEGMMNTDASGFIRPTGRVVGGHAIVIRGVSVKNKTVRLSNSWGQSWGLNGDCFLTWDDFGRLLSEDGEFCVPVKRSTATVVS